MPKSALRARMLEMRRHLPMEEQDRAARLIQVSLVSLPEYVAAASVAIYASIRCEVPTSGLIEHSLATGKAVLLPAVEAQGLVFRQIKNESELRRGALGILEPHPACPAQLPEAIDLFIIPGVAFDLAGNRVGYGKGYYDRVLHRLEAAGKFIGICYDFQLLDVIAGEPHDVIMDRVITERRVIPPYC